MHWKTIKINIVSESINSKKSNGRNKLIQIAGITNFVSHFRFVNAPLLVKNMKTKFSMCYLNDYITDTVKAGLFDFGIVLSNKFY